MIEGKDGEKVPDGVILTQLGQCERSVRGIRTRRSFSFRSALRVERGEPGMSAIAGRVTVEEAVPMVCRGDIAGSADSVRYALAEDLRREGFEIRYRKSPVVRGHVAITFDGEWDDGVLKSFDRAFHEYIPGPTDE